MKHHILILTLLIGRGIAQKCTELNNHLINIDVNSSSTTIKVSQYGNQETSILDIETPGDYSVCALYGTILFQISTTGVPSGTISVYNNDRDCTIFDIDDTQISTSQNILVHGCRSYGPGVSLQFINDMSSARKSIAEHSMGQPMWITLIVVGLVALNIGLASFINSFVLCCSNEEGGVCAGIILLVISLVVSFLCIGVPFIVNSTKCTVSQQEPPCALNEIPVLIGTKSNERSSIDVSGILNFKKDGYCLDYNKQYTWLHCAKPGTTIDVSKRCYWATASGNKPSSSARELDCGPLAVVPETEKGSVMRTNCPSFDSDCSCSVNPESSNKESVKCLIDY